MNSNTVGRLKHTPVTSSANGQRSTSADAFKTPEWRRGGVKPTNGGASAVSPLAQTPNDKAGPGIASADGSGRESNALVAARDAVKAPVEAKGHRARLQERFHRIAAHFPHLGRHRVETRAQPAAMAAPVNAQSAANILAAQRMRFGEAAVPWVAGGHDQVGGQQGDDGSVISNASSMQRAKLDAWQL